MVIHSKSHLLNNKGMWSEVEELELCWTERLSSILPGVKLSMGRTQLSMRLEFTTSTLCQLSDRAAWAAVEICLPHNCRQDWMRLCVKAHFIDRLAMVVRVNWWQESWEWDEFSVKLPSLNILQSFNGLVNEIFPSFYSYPDIRVTQNWRNELKCVELG